jgi:hypothetical protein
MAETDSWKHRRRFLYAVTLFCSAVVAYVLYAGMESRVAETAVTMAFLTITGCVGGYVFGAAWEHVRK